MSRKKWLCLDCNVDTGKIGEHYMLIDSTWAKIHNSKKGMLCIGCAEKRLGRQLNYSDFNTSYINKPNPSEQKSQRLITRYYNQVFIDIKNII